MNRIAKSFEDAWSELISNYKERVENSLYGVYYNEVEVVADLSCLIQQQIRQRKIKAEIHLNVKMDPEEWDIVSKKKWFTKWGTIPSRKGGTKRGGSPHIDIIIGDINGVEGNQKPFSVAAEVKFSMWSKAKKKTLRRRDEITRDIDRLYDLKKDKICQEVFFCYLDEYHENKLRTKMKQEIKKQCRRVVRFYHDGKTAGEYPNLYG